MKRVCEVHLALIVCVFLLVGCGNNEQSPTPINVRVPFASPLAQTATPTVIPAVAEPTATVFPVSLTDELATMSGICFAAAYDTAEQVFVLRSAEEHIHFYDLADNSGLCTRPVKRYPFDFSTGAVLAGTWTYGRGCTADHEILNVGRDDAAKRILIQTRFHQNGDCNYELIRPFWVGIADAQGYNIDILVEK